MSVGGYKSPNKCVLALRFVGDIPRASRGLMSSTKMDLFIKVLFIPIYTPERVFIPIYSPQRVGSASRKIEIPNTDPVHVLVLMAILAAIPPPLAFSRDT